MNQIPKFVLNNGGQKGRNGSNSQIRAEQFLVFIVLVIRKSRKVEKKVENYSKFHPSFLVSCLYYSKSESRIKKN